MCCRLGEIVSALRAEKISEQMLVPICAVDLLVTEMSILPSTEMDEAEMPINFLDNRTTPIQYAQEQPLASLGWIPAVGSIDSELNFVLAQRHDTASDERQDLPSIIALAYVQACRDPRKYSVVAVRVLVNTILRQIGGTHASLSPSGRLSMASLMESISPSKSILSQTRRAYKNIPK